VQYSVYYSTKKSHDNTICIGLYSFNFARVSFGAGGSLRVVARHAHGHCRVRAPALEAVAPLRDLTTFICALALSIADAYVP
jgi:hypothetical protein